MQGNLSRRSEPVKHNDEKALDAKSAIEELVQEVADIYLDMFNTTQTDFENQLNMVQHQANMIEKGIADSKARGYLDSTEYYNELSKIESNRIEKLNEELEGLRQKFQEAMDSGVIEKDSESWYAMAASVNEVQEAIADANTQLIEYQKTMRSINWSYFDYAQERFSQLQQEANFLISIMSNDKLFEDNGQFAKKGTATMGMRVANYNAYMVQADEYAKELRKINEEMAKDPYDTELIERREALLQLQQQSIQAAESEKDAIKDLVSQGIQLELNALKELIDQYTEMMSAEKELYDYEKNVRDKTDVVSKLQKQITAYGGDDSEENIARMQKLQESLKKAQDDLAETEWEHTISEQKKMLDEFYDEYSNLLNARLDDLEALVREMTNRVNEHIVEIGAELHASAEQVGYTITDAMESILNSHADGEDNSDTFSYYDKMFTGVTSITTYLDSINQKVAQLIAEANSAAKSYMSYSAEQSERNNIDISDDAKARGIDNPSTTPTYNPYDTNGAQIITVLGKRVAITKKSALGIERVTFSLVDNPAIKASTTTEMLEGDPGEVAETLVKLFNQGFHDRVYNKSDFENVALPFSTGGLADYTGPAILHGSKTKPELVLNADDTEKFLQAAKLMRTPVLNALADKEFKLTGFDGNSGGGVTIENFNADFSFEHVDSYDDFLRQMQADKRFERLVTTITSDQYVNRRSKFSKYNIQI